MDEYLGKDVNTLQDMLDASVDFQERRKIRAALTQLRGLSRKDGSITAYSFNPENRKFRTSLSSVSSLNSSQKSGSFSEDNAVFSGISKLDERSSFRESRENSVFSDEGDKSDLQESAENKRGKKPRYSSLNTDYELDRTLFKYSKRTSPLKSDTSELLLRSRTLSSSKSYTHDPNIRSRSSSSLLDSRTEELLAKYSSKKSPITNFSSEIPTRDKFRDQSPMKDHEKGSTLSSKTIKNDRSPNSESMEKPKYRSSFFVGSFGAPNKGKDLLNSEDNFRHTSKSNTDNIDALCEKYLKGSDGKNANITKTKDNHQYSEKSGIDTNRGYSNMREHSDLNGNEVESTSGTSSMHNNFENCKRSTNNQNSGMKVNSGSLDGEEIIIGNRTPNRKRDMNMDEDKLKESSNCQIDENLTMEELQDKLRQSTDFTERRKIRAQIRAIRDQKNAALDTCGRTEVRKPIDQLKEIGRTSGCSTREIIPQKSDYKEYKDIDKLRKLLAETTDYEEKKQIRLALRQLRQKDRERENGDKPTIVNGRGLNRSQSVIDYSHSNRPVNNREIIHDSDKPLYSRSISANESCVKNSVSLKSSHDKESTENGYDKRQNRKLIEASDIQGNENRASSQSSSQSFSTKDLKPILSSESNIPVTETSYKSLTLSVIPKSSKSESQPIKTSFSSVKSSSLPESSNNILQKKESSFQDLNSKSATIRCQNSKELLHSRTPSILFSNVGSSVSVRCVKDDSVLKSESDLSCKEWLDRKKRKASLPVNVLRSNMDIEAAFSDLLSAVDQKVETPSDEVDKTLLSELESNETEIKLEDSEKDEAEVQEIFEEEKVSSVTESKPSETMAADHKAQSTAEKPQHGIVSTTPVKTMERPFLNVMVSPDQNTVSEIEDDDGSVTLKTYSSKDHGDHIITEKVTLRRSESHSHEEEKDTIIETKINSPSGNTHYEKGVIKTKRKLTSRGSDYFSRSTYVMRRRKNTDGKELEQHEICLESDNFSISGGESWGDRAEASLEVSKPDHSISGGVQTDKSLQNGETAEAETKPSTGQHQHNRMDLSKTSSGYGSVSGSDEDEKEETTVTYYHGKPPDCPDIKTMLKDVITQEGSTATLECTVTCSTVPNVMWYKDGIIINMSKNYEEKFDRLSGKASLIIMDAKMEDCGEYSCVFQNTTGQAETKSRLFVKSGTLKSPDITTVLSDMTVTEGHSVILECCVKNALQVFWYKDGVIQRNSSDFKQTFDGKIAKLEICEIFLDDHGEYSCVAKNDAGESKTKCYITVKESSSDSEVVPMFLNKPSSQIINGGDKVVLECDVIGSPQPSITWTRDGYPLSENGRYKQSYDGRVAVLIISQSVREDSGKYECFAVNSAGKVSVDALIVVKARQGPPTFLHPLANVTAIVGKSLVLQCDVRGNPAPVILWRKNNRIIGNTKDFKQTYDNNLARLEISEVFQQDGGIYECVAQNSFGAISTSSSVTVKENERKNKSAEKNIEKKTGKADWLVGRGADPVHDVDADSKVTNVKRCVSMKMSPADCKIRDRFRKDFISKKEKAEPEVSSGEVNNNVESKFPSSNALSTDMQKDESPSDIDGQMIYPKSEVSKVSNQATKQTVDKDPPWKNIKLRRTESARMLPTRHDGGTPFFTKGKEESKKIVNDVIARLQLGERDSGLKRSASDRVLNFEKLCSDNEKTVEKPPGWKQVTLLQNEECEQPRHSNEQSVNKSQTSLLRSESARLPQGRPLVQNSVPKIFVTKKDDFSSNDGDTSSEVKLHRSESAKMSPSKTGSPYLNFDNKNKDKDLSSDTSGDEMDSKTIEDPRIKGMRGLQRSESARLLFERRGGDVPLATKEIPQRDESPMGRVLGRKDISVRRTSSLKITPGEREAGLIRFKNLNKDREILPDFSNNQGGNSGDSFVTKKRQLWENNQSTSPSTNSSTSAMSSTDYSQINDEDELHKILSNTDNFEERKKIRARMKELREKHSQEWEKKRQEREKNTEDIIRRKYEQAEKEKQQKLAEFDKMAKTASAERDKHLQSGQDILKDKLRQADEDKKARLAEFDKMAKKDVKVTVTKTPGGTTTIIKQTDSVSKSPGFGGTQYGKPTAEQAANFLTNQLMSTSSAGTSGRISVKTESWNSRDGVTQKTEKTESWGARPQGARGAMAAFKQMDNANAPKANSLAPGGRGGGAGRGRGGAVMRSPSAIKQMLIEWCKSKTKEYENVEITNLSTSWNDGMAFCALIHHFFPNAFDYSQLNPKNRRYNFDLAFNTAEKYADIAPLLDTDDMVKMQKPDWKCVFTYVQSIYRHLRDHDDNKQSSEQ